MAGASSSRLTRAPARGPTLAAARGQTLAATRGPTLAADRVSTLAAPRIRAASAPCGWIPALLAAASVLGCELTEVVIAAAEDVIVAETFVVLDLQEDGESATLDAYAYLHRTLDYSRDPRVGGASVRVTGASGAEVLLAEQDSAAKCVDWGNLVDVTAEGDTVAVEPIHAGTCYRAQVSPSPFAPGELLELEVVAAGGRVLTSSSRVPGAFAFEGVTREDGVCRLQPDTNLSLRWTPVADAWAYVANARIDGLADALNARDIESPDSLDLLGLAIGREDTEIVFPRQFALFSIFTEDDAADAIRELQEGMPEGTRASVSIVATDRNWTNWVRGGNFNPSGEIRIPSVFGDGTGAFATATQRRLAVVAEAAADGRPPLCGSAVTGDG